MTIVAPVNLESPPCQEPPELQLWREVLLLAIKDCRGQVVAVNRKNKRYAQGRAQAWIFSTREDPGSFKWCCEVLAIDPQAVHRQALSPFYQSLPCRAHVGRLWGMQNDGLGATFQLTLPIVQAATTKHRTSDD
jgi:hypothetical protein